MSRYGPWVEPSRADYPSQQELRDRAEEAEGRRYVELVCNYAEELEAEYEAEFGEEYRAKHPLKIDHVALHEKVMRELAGKK